MNGIERSGIIQEGILGVNDHSHEGNNWFANYLHCFICEKQIVLLQNLITKYHLKK